MPQRKAGIILQARMGSSRLPGKVMRPMAGKPMIQWIIERLKTCRIPEVLILATSTKKQDQPLVDTVDKLGVHVFRGSESDVLDRYYQCACLFKLDDIIRATGDNPLVDPEECDRVLEFYRERKLDFAIASTEKPGGYPVGVGVEVFSIQSLRTSWKKGKLAHHREHVDEYMLENPDQIKQCRMVAPKEKCAPYLSLTVDTREDFDFVEEIYRNFLKSGSASVVSTAYAIDYARKHGGIK